MTRSWRFRRFFEGSSSDLLTSLCRWLRSSRGSTTAVEMTGLASASISFRGSSGSARFCDRADMGRSVLRPYEICDGLGEWCLVLEAGGGKVAAGILHMVIWGRTGMCVEK